MVSYVCFHLLSVMCANRIRLQEEKSSGKLVLYHFVGSTSSLSADPIIMIHRLTSQVLLKLYCVFLHNVLHSIPSSTVS